MIFCVTVEKINALFFINCETECTGWICKIECTTAILGGGRLLSQGTNYGISVKIVCFFDCEI